MVICKLEEIYDHIHPLIVKCVQEMNPSEDDKLAVGLSLEIDYPSVHEDDNIVSHAQIII